MGSQMKEKAHTYRVTLGHIWVTNVAVGKGIKYY